MAVRHLQHQLKQAEAKVQELQVRKLVALARLSQPP